MPAAMFHMKVASESHFKRTDIAIAGIWMA
jgi:hypothetical protein